jgi:hypothetical protein
MERKTASSLVDNIASSVFNSPEMDKAWENPVNKINANRGHDETGVHRVSLVAKPVVRRCHIQQPRGGILRQILNYRMHHVGKPVFQGFRW